jgi:hypothetical protein
MIDSVLVIALRAAVPMWIAEANQRRGETRADLLAHWRRAAVDVVASKGDEILYLGHKRGETAKAFNALARSMAALSFHRGGFRAFSLLWCAEHSPGGALSVEDIVCRPCLIAYPKGPGPDCPCCEGSACHRCRGRSPRPVVAVELPEEDQ